MLLKKRPDFISKFQEWHNKIYIDSCHNNYFVVESAPGKASLEKAILELCTEKSRVYVDMVAFDSHAEKAGIDFDWEILGL